MFIQQTIAYKGHPQKTGALILIGVKRANFFVIILAGIVCSLSRRRTQAILTSNVDTFIFVGPDQWNSPQEIEKEKHYINLSVFPTSKPTRKFHRLQNAEEVVRREGSMLCMVSYYSVEHNNPLPSNENLDMPPRWLKV